MSGIIELEKKRYKEIVAYAKEMKATGKKIASWGAGKKGMAFVARIDPGGELLDCVFDKDAAKWGSMLSSGQEVKDYRKEMYGTDVVFLPMASFAAETTAVLLNSGFAGDIVSVEDWLLGGMRTPCQMRLEIPKLRRERVARIAALVILYQPEPTVPEHIASYADKVEMIYVWDNSPKENRCLFVDCSYAEKLRYIYSRDNYGIGEPVNKVADEARKSGMDWLLTFDQDSTASASMVDAMREYVESDILDAEAAVVAPMVDEPTAAVSSAYEEYLPYFSYVRSVITSGAMYKLEVLCDLRYRQEFFIDQLDHDFCIRVYLSGKTVVRLNHIWLHHQKDAGDFPIQEAEGIRFYMGKYSPARYYYQYRNLLYSVKAYADTAPDYVADCRAGIKKLEIMARLDSNKFAHKYALQCAKVDFEAGILGKWHKSE